MRESELGCTERGNAHYGWWERREGVTFGLREALRSRGYKEAQAVTFDGICGSGKLKDTKRDRRVKKEL